MEFIASVIIIICQEKLKCHCRFFQCIKVKYELIKDFKIKIRLNSFLKVKNQVIKALLPWNIYFNDQQMSK